MTRREALGLAAGAAVAALPAEAAPVIGTKEWLDAMNTFIGTLNAFMVTWNETDGAKIDLELWRRAQRLVKKTGLTDE